jgi:predicted aspartyl protease
MIPMRQENGLLFIDVYLNYRGSILHLPKALVDTGSAGTLISLERANEIDLRPESEDTLHRVFGVGGTEFVVAKQVDIFGLGKPILATFSVPNFTIELGSMEYGLELDAIVGLDMLCAIGAIIDLENNQILTKLKE